MKIKQISYGKLVKDPEDQFKNKRIEFTAEILPDEGYKECLGELVKMVDIEADKLYTDYANSFVGKKGKSLKSKRPIQKERLTNLEDDLEDELSSGNF